MSYKVTEFEVFGYKALIIQNVKMGRFFQVVEMENHSFWNYTLAQIISDFENYHNTQFFFSFEDAFESSKTWIELCTGTKSLSENDFDFYNTKTIKQEDVEDCLKEVKI